MILCTDGKHIDHFAEYMGIVAIIDNFMAHFVIAFEIIVGNLVLLFLIAYGAEEPPRKAETIRRFTTILEEYSPLNRINRIAAQ